MISGEAALAAATRTLRTASTCALLSLSACAGASEPSEREPATPTPSGNALVATEPAPEAEAPPVEAPPVDAAATELQLVEAFTIEGEASLVGVLRHETRWLVGVRTRPADPQDEQVVLHAHPASGGAQTRAVSGDHHVSSPFVFDGQVYLAINLLDEVETMHVVAFGDEAPTTRVTAGPRSLMSAFRTPTEGVLVRREGRGGVVAWVRGGAIARTEVLANATGHMVGASPSGLVSAWSELTPEPFAPIGPLHVWVENARGETWQRALPTPDDAGAGGEAVQASDGSVHVFLHGSNIDSSRRPSWWRVPREGAPTIVRVESGGDGYAGGQRIAACARGVALAQARRHGDELLLRAWMGTRPAPGAALELWRGEIEGAPRIAIACDGSEALVAIALDTRVEAFRVAPADAAP